MIQSDFNAAIAAAFWILTALAIINLVWMLNMAKWQKAQDKYLLKLLDKYPVGKE